MGAAAIACTRVPKAAASQAARVGFVSEFEQTAARFLERLRRNDLLQVCR
jgi:hypothetical protein